MSDRILTKNGSTLLDLVRALASQLVLVGHALSYSGIAKYLQPPYIPWMQNMAVVIFFILSGFLITYSVGRKLHDERYTVSHFMVDRFSRIYGAFLPSMFIVLLIDKISIEICSECYSYNNAYNLQTFLGNLSMLQGPFIEPFGSARPFWTLAVEWWIYVFFGLVVFYLLRNVKISITICILLFCAAVIPVYNYVGGRGNGLTVFWIFGCCLYFIWHFKLVRNISNKGKIALGVFFVGVGIARAYLIQSYYDAAVAFAFSMVLIGLLEVSASWNITERVHKIIKYMASYSFTLYLIHYSVLDLLYVQFPEYKNSIILLMVGIVMSNLLAILSGRYFEIVFTSKLKRLLMRFLDWKTVYARKT